MSASPSNSFSKKIRMTAETLGCRSLSELVERLQTVNPRSTVTLDQLYKWAQGRSQPRTFGVYDDLARLLGLREGGVYLRTASVRELSARFRRSEPESEAPASLFRTVGLREGPHAVYSLAWSRAYQGRVLRGCLKVAPAAADGNHRIEYVERYAAGHLRFGGTLSTTRRACGIVFDTMPSDVFLSMALAVPTQPSPVIGGIMSGQSFSASEPRPTSCRMIVVAFQDPGADPEAGNGYLEPGTESIARDLAQIGYAAEGSGAVAGVILDSLTIPAPGLLEVPHEAVEQILLGLTAAAPKSSGPVVAVAPAYYGAE